MINKVILKNFKRFKEEEFFLSESVVFAGPNNAGKSTLLQAIATWRLGLTKWCDQRAKSSATRRTGVPITRTDFTALPLREMNLLWEGRRVAGGGKKESRVIEIILNGSSGNREWECGLEFQYANPEMIYVRPREAKKLDDKKLKDFPPDEAKDISVVHIPPLSGIERDEPRRDRGYQDLLIGQGRPGEILRNLLLEVWESGKEHWQALEQQVESLFKINLSPPNYSPGQPFIICEYSEGNRNKPLDLSNAGSGFLQVLLLLAFFYARPATTLLMDEPDAHLHVILQKETYDLLRKIASQRNCQLLIATHSEVLLDSTDPSRVLAFIGERLHLLSHDVEKNALREALKRLTTTDLILGRDIGSVLYVEGESDEKILREWARILNHKQAGLFFERPYVHWLGGRSIKEAKDHYFALRAAFPGLRGVCLLDGDNRDEPDSEMTRAGLRVLRWKRYEIENYLLIPAAIKRYVSALPLFESKVDKEFGKQVPTGTDLFSDHVSLVRVKGSDEFLVPLLDEVGKPTPKKDLYLIAAVMSPEEIHPEVKEKLDEISSAIYG
jgi:predicted ATPase